MATCTVCLKPFRYTKGSGLKIRNLHVCPKCTASGRDALIGEVRGAVEKRFPTLFGVMSQLVAPTPQRRVPAPDDDIIDVEVIDLDAVRRERERR